MAGAPPPPQLPIGTTLPQALRSLREGHVVLVSRITLDPPFIAQLARDLSALAGRELTIDLEVDPRFTAGAALLVGDRFRVDLDQGRRFLDRLEAESATGGPEGAATLEAATERLSRLRTEAVPTPALEASSGRGRVRAVGDGVAIVTGLRDVRSQELVRFSGGVEGIAFNLLEDAVGCLLLGPEQSLLEGGTVIRTGRGLQVPVGDGLLGRVVNALGQPLDGRGPVLCERTRPVEAPAPGVVERQPVSESLHSGIKLIDALVPLGRGQRELVLGDRKIGKTTMALDVILAQRGTGVLCVYAAIGQKSSSLARALGLLREHGALEYTVVVAALAGEPPALRYVAPYAACAIAEEFMRRGRHALVVYDDLSKHAVTYREISALLERPIGREAYPGDIFYVHSRLLERAARLRDDLGGGSLTAMPIVETLAGDISALIPTNVISICDGQIVLDAGRFNEGARPAVDAGLSVSRVGGLAQTEAMRKVAGRLRIDLAQYHEMARFVKFGAEVDPATLAQLQRGEREEVLLRQGAHAPIPLEREVILLYAAVQGHTDAIPVEALPRFEARLYEAMDREHPDLLAAIRDTRDLSPETAARMDEVLAGLWGTLQADVPPAAAAG